MALVTYPLNNLDYTAEDAELFHCTRSSGIYAADDFSFSVTGADTTISIGTGIAWIRNSKFSGKVAALKEAVSKDLGVAASTYPRIDVIALRFDANANATEVVVKPGTASSNPSIPAISQTEAVYELYLYAIRREAGATVVTASDITDLRLDAKYCGLMADSVTAIDLEAIYTQLRGAIDTLNAATEAARQLYDPYSLLRMESLWTNDSPNSAFGEKTVELAVNPLEYTAVEILYNKTNRVAFGGTGELEIISSGVIPILKDEFAAHTKRYFTQICDQDYVANRYFAITETGISFESAEVTQYDPNLQMFYFEPLVPLKIYGFRHPLETEGSELLSLPDAEEDVY